MIGSCQTVPVNASAEARFVAIVFAGRISMLVPLYIYSRSIASSFRLRGAAPEYARPSHRETMQGMGTFRKAPGPHSCST